MGKTFCHRDRDFQPILRFSLRQHRNSFCKLILYLNPLSKLCQYSLLITRGGTFCQSQVTQVTSYQSLVTSYQSLVTSYQSLVTSHQLLVTSHQLLVTSHQSLVTCYSHLLLVTSQQSLVTSYQFLVTSHQLLVTSYQSLATSYQLVPGTSPQIIFLVRTIFVKDIRQKCSGGVLCLLMLIIF